MQTHRIPYKDTTIQRRLTEDYLEGKEHLKPFYQYEPSPEGMKKAVEDRPDHPVDRESLVQVLSDQYLEVAPDFFDATGHQEVAANVKALAKEHTFTVTTGHQLNILGGPLYYFYKIASTIHLAQKLNSEFPDKHFVPVYWMGTEDHDFEEISEIHLLGNTYTWEKPDEGPVGELDPSSLQKVVEIQADIREKEAIQPLIDLWHEAFGQFSKYARAAQYWLHHLFREYGLVILDPSDARLKSPLIPVFEEDLTHQSHQKLVEGCRENLDDYNLPVNPRPINIFYARPGIRERIVSNGDDYEVLDTDKSYTHKELLSTLKEQPGLFSPNVVLRPLYQQMILPNLAYIGGTNEIAYWLELKCIFDHHNAFFPQLLVRNSVLWIGKGIRKKIDKFGLEFRDLFRDTDEIVREYLSEKEETVSFDEKIQHLSEQYNELMHLCDNYEDDMKWPIINTAKAHIKDLEKLQKDTRKLIKKRNEKDVNQIEKIHNALFPEGVFQERYENFIPYYTKLGGQFIAQLVSDCDPYRLELLIYQD